MLSGVECAKLAVAIDELKKKKVVAEANLKEAQSLNESAWSMYGSELSAGGMVAKEQGIAREIWELQEQIGLLNKALKGEVDPVDEEKLKQKLNAVQQNIASLDNEKSQIEKSIGDLRFIKSILMQ